MVEKNCGNCKNWKLNINKPGCDNDLPYCKELHFFIAVDEYVHTTHDFGCVLHSGLKPAEKT